MKTRKYKLNAQTLLILFISILISSCSDDDVETSLYFGTPGKSVLVLPLNNEACEIAEIIDDLAYVTLEWNESSETEAYNIRIVNLETEEVTLNVGLTENTTTVKLLRGYPYSWVVTSRNSGEITTNSEVHRFYVSGDGESNDVPYPATLISPLSGETVKPVDGKVTLEWESETKDSGGDELTFTVFADTVDGKQETKDEWKDLTETTLEISVEDDTVYFWRVEVSDSVNVSIGTTYTFKTGEKDSSELEGTIVSTSQEILDALTSAIPGETIYVHGGDYIFNSTIEIANSGSATNNISLLAHPDDTARPTFDFSSMSENSSNRGIQLNGTYWYIKGIDVVGAGDNGMFIKGNNNTIEFCTFSENSDTGLQLGNGAANNIILNCDSFYNADSTLENADGFASKLDAGTGNKFIGCRAWNNLDDGWDGYLRGADDITTTYENCWAIKNGYLKDGTPGAGDGNGFKTGGSDDKLLKHHAVYTNCIAAGNIYDGFDHNSNRGNVEIYNSAAYDNGTNFNFGETNALAQLILKNSVAIGSYGKTKADSEDVTNNSWQDGLSATASDYESIDYSELLADRKSDGSLPDVNFMKLKSDSDLIDKGVNVGLSFNGSAPDVGVFESN